MKRQLKMHLIGGAALLGLTAAAWFPLIEPVVHARAGYNVLVTQLEAERERLAAIQAKEASQQKQMAMLREMIDKSPLLLHPSKDVNGRLQAVADLATKTGFQVDSIEAGRPEGYEKYGALEVRLSGRCRYGALAQFFEALNKTMPDMAVSATDLSGRYSDQSSIPSVSTRLRWHTTTEPGLAAR
jgi:Tfp pilus assembly protein PilO